MTKYVHTYVCMCGVCKEQYRYIHRVYGHLTVVCVGQSVGQVIAMTSHLTLEHILTANIKFTVLNYAW